MKGQKQQTKELDFIWDTEDNLTILSRKETFEPMLSDNLSHNCT